MQAEYRRDTHHSYLVLYETEREEKESFQKRMFLENRIPGFLPCTMHQIDQSERYFYDISSRQSLSGMLESRAISGDMLKKLLASILKALNGLQSFLMDTEGFCLKPEWIYVNPSGEEYEFCFFPSGDFSWKEQLQQLSEYLLPHLEHKNREAVRLGYDFYQYCMEEKITVSELEGLLAGDGIEIEGSRKEKEVEDREREKEMPASRAELLNAFFAPEIPDKTEDRREPVSDRESESEERCPFAWKKYILFLPAVFFGTGAVITWFFAYDSVAVIAAVMTVASLFAAGFLLWKKNRETETDATMEQYAMVQDWLEEERQEEQQLKEKERDTSVTDQEATCLLTGEAARSRLSRGYLIPESEAGGQTIAVSKDLTMIGKSNQMDVILRAIGISRIHARIVFREGKCFLSDMNSRNGTTLNGTLLKPQEEQLLADGDRICFANLEYQWKRYR